VKGAEKIQELKEMLQMIENKCIEMESLEIIGDYKGEFKEITDKIRAKMVGPKIIKFIQ